MDQQFMLATAGLTQDEVLLLDHLSNGLTESERNQFFTFYRSERKDPQTVLILAVLGLVSIAGIHRLFLGQILMGILYFFTAGFCFIGTIIDIVKHKEMTLKFNTQAAYDALNRVKSSGGYNSQQFV